MGGSIPPLGTSLPDFVTGSRKEEINEKYGGRINDIRHRYGI